MIIIIGMKPIGFEEKKTLFQLPRWKYIEYSATDLGYPFIQFHSENTLFGTIIDHQPTDNQNYSRYINATSNAFIFKNFSLKFWILFSFPDFRFLHFMFCSNILCFGYSLFVLNSSVFHHILLFIQVLESTVQHKRN